MIIFMLKHFTSANLGSIITGVLCLLVLIGLKQVNERYKNKMKLPIPAELLVVIRFLFIVRLCTVNVVVAKGDIAAK